MNAWGAIIIAIGIGVFYWAIKHSGSLSGLAGGVAATTGKAAVHAVVTNPVVDPANQSAGLFPIIHDIFGVTIG